LQKFSDFGYHTIKNENNSPCVSVNSKHIILFQILAEKNRLCDGGILNNLKIASKKGERGT